MNQDQKYFVTRLDANLKTMRDELAKLGSKAEEFIFLFDYDLAIKFEGGMKAVAIWHATAVASDDARVIKNGLDERASVVERGTALKTAIERAQETRNRIVESFESETRSVA